MRSCNPLAVVAFLNHRFFHGSGCADHGLIPGSLETIRMMEQGGVEAVRPFIETLVA